RYNSRQGNIRFNSCFNQHSSFFGSSIPVFFGSKVRKSIYRQWARCQPLLVREHTIRREVVSRLLRKREMAHSSGRLTTTYGPPCRTAAGENASWESIPANHESRVSRRQHPGGVDPRRGQRGHRGGGGGGTRRCARGRPL